MKVFNKNNIEQIRLQYKNGLKVKRKNKIYHQNIVNVRKMGIVYDYSHEELVEYAKCSDFNYFISNYSKIKLYSFQKEVIEHFKKNKFSINMKSRQTGIPRILMLYFLHEILYNNEKSIIVFNVKSCEGMELSNIFKEAYKSLPFFMQIGIKIWNTKNIIFENGSSITFRTYTKNLGIDANYHIWLLNDYAHVSSSISEAFQKANLPIISALNDSRLIIISSPNGMNHFYDILQGAEAGINSFKSIRTYWWQVPNRGKEWKAEQIYKIGENAFAQDYDLFILKK